MSNPWGDIIAVVMRDIASGIDTAHRAGLAEGRKQGLEEAAAWHDAQAYAAECADDTMQGVRNGEPHRKAAAAIRALKESK